MNSHRACKLKRRLVVTLPSTFLPGYVSGIIVSPAVGARKVKKSVSDSRSKGQWSKTRIQKKGSVSTSMLQPNKTDRQSDGKE